MTNCAKKRDNFQIDLCKRLRESQLNKVSLIFEISFLFVLPLLHKLAKVSTQNISPTSPLETVFLLFFQGLRSIHCYSLIRPEGVTQWFSSKNFFEKSCKIQPKTSTNQIFLVNMHALTCNVTKKGTQSWVWFLQIIWTTLRRTLVKTYYHTTNTIRGGVFKTQQNI